MLDFSRFLEISLYEQRRKSSNGEPLVEIAYIYIGV